MLLIVLVGATSFTFNTRSVRSSSTALFGGSHRGRYGNFLDILPRPKDPKKEELLERLGVKDIEKRAPSATGQEKRKDRERDLKIAKAETPVIEYPVPLKKRNWSDEEIDTVIDCLNLSYGNKKREELSDKERIGLIDWSEFDMHAEERISDYSTPQVRNKVVSWIKYHIKKKEIRFDYDEWIFSPETCPNRGRRIRQARKMDI
jgi:hypothetical protein